MIIGTGDDFQFIKIGGFRTNWGDVVRFRDGRLGELNFEMGKDFSDFLVWRKDGIPAYEFATVVDDYLMEITEIVRGEDLLVSSARQCLLFDVLKYTRPNFYHCSLSVGKDGTKLSKSSRLNSSSLSFLLKSLWLLPEIRIRTVRGVSQKHSPAIRLRFLFAKDTHKESEGWDEKAIFEKSFLIYAFL